MWDENENRFTKKIELPEPKEFHNDTVNYLAQQRGKVKATLNSVKEAPMTAPRITKVNKKRTDSPPINAKEYLKNMKHAAIDYSNLDEIGEDNRVDGGSSGKDNGTAQTGATMKAKQHPALLGKKTEAVK